MPIIGEIQTGKKLGKRDKHKRWFIYAACIDCGKERWSQLKLRDSKVTFLRCNICSHHARKGCVSAFKGRTHTAEVKLQNSLAHKGKKLTEEHKLKTSLSVKTYYRLHPEIWDRLHKSNTGKKRTPEQNAESSLRNKGKIISEEQKIKAAGNNQFPYMYAGMLMIGILSMLTTGIAGLIEARVSKWIGMR